MAIKIHVKNIKPFKEISPEVQGKKLPVTLGVRVYSSEDLKEMRESFRKLISNPELELYLAKLEKLEKEGDKAEETFYEERKQLQDKIDSLVTNQELLSSQFYKSQILFIKNASIEIEEDGKVKDMIVPDTQTVTPIESLWENPEECLAVLLDAYFSVPPIRDSLVSKITDVILNFQSEAKTKN